jgi:hypothetical protein
MNIAQTIRKPPAVGHRFADLKSSTYNPTSRTIEAVLSVGAAVQRAYGTEVLLIAPSAVDLTRVTAGLCPILDSHQIGSISNVLGRLEEAHFESGKLVGTLSFDESEQGRAAEAMVARGAIRGISIGYSVSQWTITDSDGGIIDPDRERLAWDEEYVFTATKWILLETSLVSVPADANATIRSFGQSPPIGAAMAAEITGRMRARQLIAERNTSEPEPLQCRRRYPGGRIWRGDA